MTETVINVPHNAIKLILPENSGSYAVIYLPKLSVSMHVTSKIMYCGIIVL